MDKDCQADLKKACIHVVWNISYILEYEKAEIKMMRKIIM